MYQYKVKSNPGTEICMNILSETDDSLFVSIVTINDGYETERKETMPRRLFEICLNTAYLTEIPAQASAKSA